MTKVKAKEVLDNGKLIGEAKSFPDPWYGRNFVAVYQYNDTFYQVSYSDSTDPRWWSCREVAPKVKQVTEWVPK